MHKILVEENFRPSIESQKRLNPNMKEMVKAKVLKLLDTNIIYPISNSAWISPTQVVPKKGRIMVVPNEKNELIRKDHLNNQLMDEEAEDKVHYLEIGMKYFHIVYITIPIVTA